MVIRRDDGMYVHKRDRDNNNEQRTIRSRYVTCNTDTRSGCHRDSQPAGRAKVGGKFRFELSTRLSGVRTDHAGRRKEELKLLRHCWRTLKDFFVLVIGSTLTKRKIKETAVSTVNLDWIVPS